MDSLITILIVMGSIAGIILIWSLYKIYCCAQDATKRVFKLWFWGLLILATIYVYKSPVFDDTGLKKVIYRVIKGGLGVAILVLCYSILVFLHFLPHYLKKLTNKMKRNLKQKQKKEKAKPFKIEIVNNEKYINLKKDKRIAFLRNLKKQTVAELTKQKKELSKEIEKIENIPTDVVKYVKTTNKTKIENNISKLENKINAINELIGLETKK